LVLVVLLEKAFPTKIHCNVGHIPVRARIEMNNRVPFVGGRGRTGDFQCILISDLQLIVIVKGSGVGASHYVIESLLSRILIEERIDRISRPKPAKHWIV
jgi:hypothetical protein